jgi:Tol biopolymer transport system component
MMTSPTRVLMAVATGVVVLASASTATAAPRTERLAFAADVQGNVDVYTVRTDGSRVRRLTHSPAFDACARYSPDGRWIAWCSGVGAAGGVIEIWIMRGNGRRMSQLTHLGGRMTFPDFSPDGRTVVFSGLLAGVSNNEIYATSVQGSGLTQLTDDPAEDLWAAFSPDGSRIAFISARTGLRQLWIMNADGSNPTQVTTDSIAKGQLPRWSPDGHRIAYSTDDPLLGQDIWVIDADGRNPIQLTRAAAREFGPDWSPDGEQLAYVDGSDPAQRTVMIINADGTGARPVKPFGNQFVPSWQPITGSTGL